MSTSRFVNYSLRPSKSIQRQLGFAGIRALKSRFNLQEAIYVGFGSVWFTDFVMAHNMLDIDRMISMETDNIMFRRAEFNAPYASVTVRHGSSSAVLPTLYQDITLNTVPWVMWLDYDASFDERTIQDTRTAIERSPGDTILLITFNAGARKYGGSLKERLGRLQDLFGELVPSDLSGKYCKDAVMKETLADLAISSMKSAAADMRRVGGFVPAFRMLYRDGADMVTVGGILPSSFHMAQDTEQLLAGNWTCMPEEVIVSPLLTMREAKVLQAQLPSSRALTREQIRRIGFDLEDEQIRAYEKYYKEYPAFAQVVI